MVIEVNEEEKKTPVDGGQNKREGDVREPGSRTGIEADGAETGQSDEATRRQGK